MPARIYKPSKAADPVRVGADEAMASRLRAGQAAGDRAPDGLDEPRATPASSCGSGSTPSEEAVAYAEREGIAYRVEEPHEAKRRTMSYSDNFKFNRVGPWTH